LAVASGLADHSLHVAQTTAALRIGVFAIVQSLGAPGLDVSRDARRSGFPDVPLDRGYGVLETVTDQSLGFTALLKNRHAHFRAGHPVAGCGMEIRHSAGRRGAKQEPVQ
jgi:hypothetical protein